MGGHFGERGNGGVRKKNPITICVKQLICESPLRQFESICMTLLKMSGFQIYLWGGAPFSAQINPSGGLKL